MRKTEKTDDSERKPVVDLHKLPESERFRIIGNLAMMRHTVGVMLEDDTIDKGKIDRYIAGVAKLFPRVSVLKRAPGPVAGVELITFGVAQDAKATH